MIKKPARIVDPKLLSRIKEGRCVVCGARKVDACHIKTRGSGGNDEINNVFAQCRRHHNEQGALGWERYTKKYPIVTQVLESLGWEIQEVLGRKKLVRMEEENGSD